MPRRKTDDQVRRDVTERPRSPRTTVRLVTPAQGPDGAADLEILNISRTGMLFRHRSAREDWSPVEVLLPNGKRVAGSVSWTDEDLVGFKFDAAISQADLAAIVLKGDPFGPRASRPSSSSSRFRDEEDILSNLSELRAAAGMSMDELAQRVGVSRQAVWYWEQGRSSPRPGAMRVLQNLFGGEIENNSVTNVQSQVKLGEGIARKKSEIADLLGIDLEAIRIIIEQ